MNGALLLLKQGFPSKTWRSSGDCRVDGNGPVELILALAGLLIPIRSGRSGGRPGYRR